MIEKGNQHIPVQFTVRFGTIQEVIHCHQQGIRMLRYCPRDVILDPSFIERGMKQTDIEGVKSVKIVMLIIEEPDGIIVPTISV